MEAYRTAYVYVRDTFAGTLKETDYGYSFVYDSEYLENENASAVKSNITVIISDNLTTGMTGGQDSAGTNKFEAICLGLGVEPEHVRVVVPLPKNMEEITRTIKEEIEYNGVSVIIPRRECIQTAARHAREKAKAKKA